MSAGQSRMERDSSDTSGDPRAAAGVVTGVTTAPRQVDFAPIMLEAPGPSLGRIVFYPVRVDSVLIGDQPRLRWFCPGTNSLYSFVRSQQPCQMGQVQVVARCRIRESRTRYVKPYQFAALKVQSRREWEATRARLAAGGGGDDIVLEKGIMLALKGHPFACELLEQWHDPDNVYTVLEFLNEGELISLVSKHPQSALDEDTARWLFVQAILGLKALHDLGYCHKDVSCENVLVHRPPVSDASAAAVAAGASPEGGAPGAGGMDGAGKAPPVGAGPSAGGTGAGTGAQAPPPALLRRAKVIDFGAACALRKHKVVREVVPPQGTAAGKEGGLPGAVGASSGTPAGPATPVSIEVWEEARLPPPEVPFGKPAYMAPEYYSRHPAGYFGRRVDVWAMGIILYIMLEGEYLVEVPARTDPKYRQIASNRIGVILQSCQLRRQKEQRPPLSNEAANLLAGLLRTDPDRRPPDMDSILRHRWCQPALPAAAGALRTSLDQIVARARRAVAIDRGIPPVTPGSPPPPAGSPEAAAREAISKIPLQQLPLPPSAYLIAKGLLACFEAAKRPPPSEVRTLAAMAPPAPGMPVARSKHRPRGGGPGAGSGAPSGAGAGPGPGAGAGAGAGAGPRVAGAGDSSVSVAPAGGRARSEVGPPGAGSRAGGGPAVPGVGFDGRAPGMSQSAVPHSQSGPSSSSGTASGGYVGMDGDDDL